MNPFESPPSTPPVGFDLPSPPTRRAPRRMGVMAAVALTSAGLVAGGVAVVSQMASANEPSIDPIVAAGPEPGDETIGTDTAPDTAPDTTLPEPQPAEPDHDRPVLDGQITIDIGDGEPITIDLGQIGDCIDLPMLRPGEFDLPDLPERPLVFGEGHVVVSGPEGVSVVDFGDGDGSVTITKSGDAITVESDGDVTVNEPGQLLPEIPPLPDFPDFDTITDCLDQE